MQRWPLDESELDYKAETRGWEKISTEKSTAPMVSYRRDGARLNFWLSTGTVGSYLEHPRQGKTQLFRRKTSMNAANALFDNPRVHTGSGYHRRADMGSEPRRGRSHSPQRGAAQPSRSRSRERGPSSGTAMRWNETRGFGFIKPDEGGDNVFCHCSAILGGNMLLEGESVFYTLGWDERRRKHRAEEVNGRAVAVR